MPCRPKKYSPFGRTPSIYCGRIKNRTAQGARFPDGGGLLALCGSSQGRSGGFLGTADYCYENGVGVLGKLPKHLLFPSLCPSCAGAAQRLPPPAGACIVLPRAAPRNAAARTPRTGYCGRRRRSDRPFRTGFMRWLENGETLSQAPVFHEFLESIYFQTYKVLFGRRVRSWLRTNAGGAPNTCKSRG